MAVSSCLCLAGFAATEDIIAIEVIGSKNSNYKEGIEVEFTACLFRLFFNTVSSNYGVAGYGALLFANIRVLDFSILPLIE